jgi:predicted GH43/DUF377 family glycosyl hydrolase/CheY-like chemotaxis protein
MAINIVRLKPFFAPDPKRVIVRFFMPGGESRAKKIIKRIEEMSNADVTKTLNQTLRDFSNRHRNITRIFQKHFERVAFLFEQAGTDPTAVSQERKLLTGAYFTHEYSIESAAFFNPSIVEDPDQSHLDRDQKRVIISFRATGEGHVSSIAFRGAILDKDNNLTFNQVSKLVDVPETIQLHEYNKEDFLHKLGDMNLKSQDTINKILASLNATFLFRELQHNIRSFLNTAAEITIEESKVLQAIKFIANSQYEISFSLDTSISERVIFPVTDAESNGIEDARFVKFTDDDGSVRYYATYTAYNGVVIMPQLIETKDFYSFRVLPIYGKNAQNKGMALFPRKINGHYAMLSRHDGENNYIMYSDQINNWDGDATLIQEPEFPWEFVQLGNSGSPIETDKGWLVMTHGVGPVRKYVMGAVLLDLNNPSKLIAKLTSPLLSPNESEREGYVPNVVYSCGALLNNGNIILPYAMSDTSSGFAAISVNELLYEMKYIHESTPEKKAAKTKKILVVEDDPTNALVVTAILSNGGYETETATNGLEAIDKLTKMKFDLILSDVAMPKFNGYQLLEFITAKNINIPVVFLSASTDAVNEIKGLRLGAVEYIHKPVDADLLLLRLQKVV